MAEFGSSVLKPRFWAKVQVEPAGCWVWTAYRDPEGYGRYEIGRTPCLAHQVAYEAFNTWVPAGLELDHLCHNPACVNPDHLEPVTHQENIQRGDMTGGGQAQRAKTHCPQGHPYDAANTYIVPSTGYRRCRACSRERNRPT